MRGKLNRIHRPVHWILRLTKVFGRKQAFVTVLAAALVLSSGSLLAAEKGPDPVPDRWRVFSLRHIPAEKGKEYLAELGIGTVSQLADANVLLVTAQPRELIKASAVLKLVDAKEEFAIKTILPSASAQGYPSKEQIAAAVGNMLIGTFSEPPIGPERTKAIIDVHNDAVITIAPVNQLEGIISAVEKLQTPGRQEALKPAELDTPAEPKIDETARVRLTVDIGLEGTTDPNELAAEPDANESDATELFSRLLKSLAEAEKRAAQQATEPNEPKAVTTEPEPNEPFAVPTVPEIEPSTEPPEAPEAPVEQPKEIDLAVILGRLAALEAEIKGKLEPKPEPEVKAEPVTEPVPVKIEHPNEVNEVNEAAEPEAKKDPYAPTPLPHGEEVIGLNLGPKLPIEQFLNFVGNYLQLDFLYDPEQLKGNVTLMLNGEYRGPVKVKDLYPYLESVMQFHGFLMTRKGNLVTIRPLTDPGTIDPPIVGPGEDDKVEHGDVAITRVFQLEHIDTASAENLLKGMQLGVKVIPIPEAKTLFVTGYAYRMGRIEKLLKIVDKPGKPRKFRFRELQYTMAETLAPKIKTLAEQLGTISVTVAAPSPRPQTTPRSIRDPRTGKPRATDTKRPGITRQPAVVAPKQPPAQEGVYLEADERTNRILMIGLVEQLDIVNTLINELDVEQQDLRLLRAYEIQHVDAEEVRLKLEELGIVSAGRATTARRGAAGRTTGTTRTPGATGAAGAAGRARQTPPAGGYGTRTAEEALVDEPQVVILEAINSLLVNATPEQHNQIVTIISYVDSETLADTIPYVVYPLENQDPEALAGILNQLIQETITQQDKAGTKIIKETKAKTEEQITIIPDENTFSLIVYATKKNQQWIESLIKQLDKRRPQVLIDVTLVQITKDDAFAVDLNFLTSIPDMAYTSLTIPGFSSSIVDLLTAPESDRGKFLELMSSPSGEGFPGTAFFGDEKINALLTVMQAKDYGRVMARPKLLVNDNETGSIQTTDTTFIERKSKSVIPGGGSEPVTSEQVNFDDYSAGITMTITPHISEGDMLRLDITLNRSGFTEDIAEGLTKPPNKSDADVSTIVTVPDKSTIILGGMEKVSHSKGGRKIPILGDIPLIGGLFREVARSGGHDKLYIFVKAHILRPSGEFALDDLKAISQKNREAFEKLEREMDLYEDWPGITPVPLDPISILETD